jgi:hypothetical protein
METRICLRFLHDNCFTTDCAFVHPKTGQELPVSDLILVTVNLGPVLMSLKRMVMEETFDDDDPAKEKASNDTQAGVYRIHYMRPFNDLMKNIRHRIQVKQFIDDEDFLVSQYETDQMLPLNLPLMTFEEYFDQNNLIVVLDCKSDCKSKFKDILDDQQTCRICLRLPKNVKSNERCRLNCGHYYHRSCIQDWINTFTVSYVFDVDDYLEDATYHRTCPYCNTRIENIIQFFGETTLKRRMTRRFVNNKANSEEWILPPVGDGYYPQE